MLNKKFIIDFLFLSRRRRILNKKLNMYFNSIPYSFLGKIVDAGGKRYGSRGVVFPPFLIKNIIYLNIDESSRPNILADICQIPLENESIDKVLCCEVLEHLEEPQEAIKEIYRVLKKGGELILSVPFLFPIHPDPRDYQRFTDQGIMKLLSSFSYVCIEKMGGYFTVLTMFLETEIVRLLKGKWRLFLLPVILLITLIACLDSTFIGRREYLKRYTTGYFVICRKQ